MGFCFLCILLWIEDLFEIISSLYEEVNQSGMWIFNTDNTVFAIRFMFTNLTDKIKPSSLKSNLLLDKTSPDELDIQESKNLSEVKESVRSQRICQIGQFR